jgi:hypothetical protein
MVSISHKTITTIAFCLWLFPLQAMQRNSPAFRQLISTKTTPTQFHSAAKEDKAQKINHNNSHYSSTWFKQPEMHKNLYTNNQK